MSERTHTCGELRETNVGEKVTLSGWIHRRRDHGGLIFLDLRDKYGLTQVVFDPKKDENLHERANRFRNEWTITISGHVAKRAPGMANPKLDTGDIEVEVCEVTVHAEALPPPFEIDDEHVKAGEEIRLKYRYLDLRRFSLANRLKVRHDLNLLIRNFLSNKKFIEVTTPLLGKPTPEGARDYLVPSRVFPSNFYALPQSPQIYKQLLMVGGIDKYFQIATCMRDEDLRADRQPEFTQLDIEVSFSSRKTFFTTLEELLRKIFKEIVQVELPSSFPSLKYHECIERYGTDKPDIRFGMELRDISPVVPISEFSIFQESLAQGKIVKGITVPKGSSLSRKEIDAYTQFVGTLGIKGLAWMKVDEAGILQGGISKFFPQEAAKELIKLMEATPGDLLFFIADESKIAHQALDQLRRKLAQDLDLIPKGAVAPLWVLDFPLFAKDAESGRLVSEHHPFTYPKEEDLPLLDKDPINTASSSYDIVINGYEIGSGSQRIHDSKLQAKIFSLLNFSEEDIQSKFGFFVDALKYGTPPHMGIALGIERLVMILTGTDNIRDVIAFPKTQKAQDLMSRAPSPADPIQLEELKIVLEKD